MDRLTLLGTLSAHAAANGADPDKAWAIATELAAEAPADITEDWLQQACAYVSSRALTGAWGLRTPQTDSAG